jgi:hypothetical protein
LEFSGCFVPRIFVGSRRRGFRPVEVCVVFVAFGVLIISAYESLVSRSVFLRVWGFFFVA